jgi:hypothetical protein
MKVHGRPLSQEKGRRQKPALRFACRFGLQIPDGGFSLFRGQLLLKTLPGFPEAGIAVNFFGAAR